MRNRLSGHRTVCLPALERLCPRLSWADFRLPGLIPQVPRYAPASFPRRHNNNSDHCPPKCLQRTPHGTQLLPITISHTHPCFTESALVRPPRVLWTKADVGRCRSVMTGATRTRTGSQAWPLARPALRRVLPQSAAMLLAVLPSVQCPVFGRSVLREAVSQRFEGAPGEVAVAHLLLPQA